MHDNKAFIVFLYRIINRFSWMVTGAVSFLNHIQRYLFAMDQ